MLYGSLLKVFAILAICSTFLSILHVYCKSYNTILNLIQRMKKNNFDFEKHDFLVKVVNRSYINIMRICEELISYIKLDHTFH